jgi:hypothetical protein
MTGAGVGPRRSTRRARSRLWVLLRCVYYLVVYYYEVVHDQEGNDVHDHDGVETKMAAEWQPSGLREGKKVNLLPHS